MYINKKAKEAMKANRKLEAQRFLLKSKNLEKMAKKDALTLNLLFKQQMNLENFNSDTDVKNIIKDSNKVLEELNEKNEDYLDVLADANDLDRELNQNFNEQINILEQMNAENNEDVDAELNELLNEDKYNDLEKLNTKENISKIKEKEENDVLDALLS